MVTEVSRDVNGVLVPRFDVLFQDFMEKKENLFFMRDPLDGSNKELRKVYFVIVLSIFEEKNMTTSAFILSRCVYTI
jgi:hypothetical protein